MTATGRDRADRESRPGASGAGEEPDASPRAGGGTGRGGKAGRGAEAARGARTQHADDPDRDDRRSGPALPRGPQALPREQVARHQRERLYKAMVECVDERGYVATTISELVARARISRRSFYEHFHNKDECLLATYDTVVERLRRRLDEAQNPAEDWDEQLESYIRTLFDAAGDRPDAARLVCVEMGAAGPIGVQRWADGAERLQQYIVAGFARADGPGTVPDPVARAIVGAVRRILYTRVEHARSSKSLRADLSELVPDLLAWIACYYPSPGGAAAAPVSPCGAVPATPRATRSWHARLGDAHPGTLSARRCRVSAGCRAASTTCRAGSSPTTSASAYSTRSPTSRPTRGYPTLSLDEVADRGGRVAADVLRPLRRQGRRVRGHV